MIQLTTGKYFKIKSTRMKKVYFLLLLSFLSFKNFAAVWYANSGDATDVTNWWSDPGYTGTHPVDFSSAADIWNMNGGMNTSATWAVAGSLIINSGIFYPGYDVSIGTNGTGGDLTMNGSCVFSGSNEIEITLYGNLFVTGASSWNNPPAYSHVHFANTGSSLASPQNISWTSTNSGQYVSYSVDAGATVQLLSDVILPSSQDQADFINGTLVAGVYTIDVAGNDVYINNGASLYTQNATGADGTIFDGTYHYNGGANYIFNGTLAQATGINMPMGFTPGGGVTINNVAGVSLSQNTSFQDGSTLTLTSGNLWLGANFVSFTTAATLAGTFSASSMIVTNGLGQLIKQFAADGSFTYPVGDAAANYTPIMLNMTGATYGPNAYAGVNVVNAKHPANVNTDDYLNRYWSISTADITTPSYTAVGTYVPDDVTGTEANISAGEYAGLPWHKFGPVDATLHTLTTGAVTDVSADVSGISTAGPAVTASADTAICIGSSATIGVISAVRDSPFTFTWAPADGLSATTGMSVVATPTVTTSYTVTVTDGNGFTATAMTNVTVNLFPTVDTVTGTGSYCAGGSGVHIGLNLSDTGVNYQVYHLGATVGAPVAGTGVALDLGAETAAGSYSVMGTGAHTGCAINMADSAFVTIIPVVIPTVTLSSSMSDTLCAGTITTFNAAFTHGGTAPSFHWTKNGANVGTDSMNYSVAPTDGNVIVVKLMSNEVCAIPDSVTDTFVIAVMPNGTPTVAIASTPAAEVCSGTMVTVNATPTFGGYTPSYTWVLNTINVSSAASYSYVPSNGDHIYAILNSNYRCRLATTAYSNVVDLIVDSPIVPYLTIAAYPGLYIPAGKPDTFVATVYSAGTAPLYQWYLNNVPVPAATTNTFIRSSFTTNDSISCEITRNDVCAMSSINSVVVKVHPVGVEHMSLSGADITLLPNPNNGSFTVKGTLGAGADEEVTMEITNMLGQVVYNAKSMAQNGVLNEQVNAGANLPAGIYILALHTANASGTFRFVVEK